MAHKKGVGSSRNGRDSGPKYLGVKMYAGEQVVAGNIIVRQRVRPSLLQSQTMACPSCAGTGRVFLPETVVRRLERSLKRAAAAANKDRRLVVRLHPEVALFLLEEEPQFLKTQIKATGIDLEVRDDPMMKLDELKLMSQPAGRDVTEAYLVA